MIDFYFLGIGGTAMANVAAAMQAIGFKVSGSDKTVYSPMCDFLRGQNIHYHESFEEKHLQEEEPKNIVVGNAISRGNVELEFALSNRMRLVSMPEVIKEYLIQKHTSIVVSGTHGKTTTTSLLAWLLETCGVSPGFIVGGIPENFEMGCRSATSQIGGYFVSEGDEYDTSFFDKRSKFLHYRPDIAIINNLEFDHADIFKSLEDIKESFKRFVNLIPKNGLLLLNIEDAEAMSLEKYSFAPVQTFGLSIHATWQAKDLLFEREFTEFSLYQNGAFCYRFTSPLLGEHNIRNALAAISTCIHLGFHPEVIQKGLLTFKNIKRRLELVYNENGISIIDDFAHHPSAIRETIKAVKQRFPSRRIIACFEPRSNTTSRNIFQQDLVSCFEFADVIVIGKIDRPERYDPAQRLNTEKIVQELTANGKKAYHTPLPLPENYPINIVNFVSSILHDGDVILVMSNGNFGNLKLHLIETLKNH